MGNVFSTEWAKVYSLGSGPMRVSRSMLMLRQACFETGSIKAGAWLRGHFSSFCCQSQQGELFRFFNLNCRVVHCLQSSFPPLLMNFLN